MKTNLPPEEYTKLLEKENDNLRARLRGQQNQDQQDSAVAPKRLTRDQIRLELIKANPELKPSSDLFREAMVFAGVEQEGTNLKRLANFLGFSKREVQNHLLKIARKIERARLEQLEKANAEAAGQTDQDSTTPQTDAVGVLPEAGAIESGPVANPDSAS